MQLHPLHHPRSLGPEQYAKAWVRSSFHLEPGTPTLYCQRISILRKSSRLGMPSVLLRCSCFLVIITLSVSTILEMDYRDTVLDYCFIARWSCRMVMFKNLAGIQTALWPRAHDVGNETLVLKIQSHSFHSRCLSDTGWTPLYVVSAL